jgi:hypothetical protein
VAKLLDFGLVLAAEVERLGGQTEFEQPAWVMPCVGDFDVLADRLCVIELQNTAIPREEAPRTE